MFETVGLLGRAAIITGFAATIIAAAAYFRSLKTPEFLRFARGGLHVTAASVILASAALLILIVKHQFQFHYVWAYSSRELPIGLLMSTFYAGQEGSFLLWTLMVVIVGIVLLGYTQKHGNEREVMGVYMTILAFLLLLIVVKNPFELIEGGIVPPDGRGLNPLLQNFWMQIHPPILFVGFAAMAPPFAMAIAGLMQRKYQDWVTSSLPWVVGGAMLLGLGIALGGFWAYETLGWGGWWGWDPVENSSLIPWLVSLALVHTMMTQKRTKGLILTNFILAILSFVTVLYSTFLTRSGVLGDASVHSFVDPGRFAFTLLVLFMFVFIDLGLVLLFVRFTKYGARLVERWSGAKLLVMLYLIGIGPSIPIFATVAGDIVPVFADLIATAPAVLGILVYPLLGMAHLLNLLSVLWLPALLIKIGFILYTITGRLHSDTKYTSFAMLSRETMLGIGSAVIGGFTVIVLLGTSLPIVPDAIIESVNGLLTSMGSSTTLGNTVEPAFYDAMGLPIAIAMAILIGLALLLKWKVNEGGDLLKKLMLPAAIAVVFTIVLAFVGDVTDPGMLALAVTSMFTFAVNAQVGYRILRGNPRFTGAYIAHIGIALMFLGIIGSGFYSTKQVMELPQGTTKEALGYKLTYVGYEPFWNDQRYFFKVRVDNMEGKTLDTVYTVMFISNYGDQEQLMRNPGIAKSFMRDIYVEPQALEAPDPEGGVRRQYRKGLTFEYAGYKVTFLDFDMNNSDASQSFTIGGLFRVEKYGQDPVEVNVTRTQDASGVTMAPGVVPAGDLEVSILGMTPNQEDLALSTVEVRLRNPNIAVDPNNLRDVLVVEASIKPFISLVWIGIIMMMIGFTVAMFRRARDARSLAVVASPEPVAVPDAGAPVPQPAQYEGVTAK